VVGVVPPAFQEDCSSKAHLEDFKTSEIRQGQLKKTLGAAPRNLLSNRSKGFFKLTGFQKLCANKKLYLH
jgi:hypothetical protein